MLPEYIKKVKAWCEENKNDLFVALIIFLVGMASFGLGRLSAILPEDTSIRVEEPEEHALRAYSSRATGQLLQDGTQQIAGTSNTIKKATPSLIQNAKSPYVASKSGSVYYAVWCSGVSRIREENRVWFATPEQAKARGYRPAKNCQGIY